MNDPMREPDEASAALRALHVFFCVDCSGSMAGDRIEAVNDALRSTFPTLLAGAKGDPGLEVSVRVLAFADRPEWRVAGEGGHLVAGGETNMALALRELGEGLSSAGQGRQQTFQGVILISDGLPTDDGAAGLAAFERCPAARNALRIAIAIGSDADIGLLQSFVGRAGLAPLLAQNPEALRGHVEWATDALVRASGSQARVAARELAAEAARRNEQIGETLW